MFIILYIIVNESKYFRNLLNMFIILYQYEIGLLPDFPNLYCEDEELFKND